MSSIRYIDKAAEYDFLKPWLNDGLLLSTGQFTVFFFTISIFLLILSNIHSVFLSFFLFFYFYCKIGKKWHDRRKIITPAFHFKMLEKFSESFDRISNIFVEKIRACESNKAIEFFHMVELFALDVVCGESTSV